MDFCRQKVESDCVELLSRFQRTESVRFNIFCNIWKEMNFSHIFYGTVTLHEKRVFSRLILDMASTFFMPPYSFQIRVGGLYLLYSLHQCQTASPSVQIRLALKDWEDVEKFEKDAVDAQHFDAVYILRRLMHLKAFNFTAMPTLLVYKKKRKLENAVTLCEDFIERPSRPQELINVELLEVEVCLSSPVELLLRERRGLPGAAAQELSNIHQLYGKLKTSFSSASEQADSSIKLVRKDLVPQLRSTVVDFYNWQQRKDGGDEGEDSGEGTSTQQECSNRASLLAAIKSKAYGEAAEASRSRRHRQVEVDLTSNEAGPSTLAGHSKASKPSLKARTCENIHISGDIWKEVTTTTWINRLTTLDYVPEERPKIYPKFKW